AHAPVVVLETFTDKEGLRKVTLQLGEQKFGSSKRSDFQVKEKYSQVHLQALKGAGAICIAVVGSPGTALLVAEDLSCPTCKGPGAPAQLNQPREMSEQATLEPGPRRVRREAPGFGSSAERGLGLPRGEDIPKIAELSCMTPTLKAPARRSSSCSSGQCSSPPEHSEASERIRARIQSRLLGRSVGKTAEACGASEKARGRNSQRRDRSPDATNVSLASNVARTSPMRSPSRSPQSRVSPQRGAGGRPTDP
ncbi:unnamed protein product, partial [Effrenium voratum]